MAAIPSVTRAPRPSPSALLLGHRQALLAHLPPTRRLEYLRTTKLEPSRQRRHALGLRPRHRGHSRGGSLDLDDEIAEGAAGIAAPSSMAGRAPGRARGRGPSSASPPTRSVWAPGGGARGASCPRVMGFGAEPAPDPVPATHVIGRRPRGRLGCSWGRRARPRRLISFDVLMRYSSTAPSSSSNEIGPFLLLSWFRGRAQDVPRDRSRPRRPRHEPHLPPTGARRGCASSTGPGHRVSSWRSSGSRPGPPSPPCTTAAFPPSCSTALAAMMLMPRASPHGGRMVSALAASSARRLGPPRGRDESASLAGAR